VVSEQRMKFYVQSLGTVMSTFNFVVVDEEGTHYKYVGTEEQANEIAEEFEAEYNREASKE
jgi:hypothetical protein